MDLTVEDTRYISLNTQHGVSRSSNSDYTTSFLSDVTFNFKGLLKEDDDILFSYIDIVNCQIPVSFYNINYSTNTLKYKINGGTTLTLTLTHANYNTTSLMAELIAQFLLAGYTFTITFNKPLGKFTFASSTNFSFLSASLGSTISEILGFDSVLSYTSSSNILQSQHPASLLGIKKLKFTSTALSTSSISSGIGGSSCFGIVPVNAPPFGIIQYSNNSGRKSVLKNKVIDLIDLQVFDENNRYINFNNTEWSITLAITSIRKYRDTENDNTFSDMITPILKVTNPEIDLPVVENNNMFSDETDLDFFMYKNGVNI